MNRIKEALVADSDLFLSDAVVAAFSCREDGNMSLSEGDTVSAQEHRSGFLSPLGIDAGDLVTPVQVHADAVCTVTADNKGKSIPDTDALITQERGVPIAVFSADCLTLFAFDTHTPAIGVIHAGWRSTHKGIVSRTIAAMRSSFSTNPTDLRIVLGPAIRNCCYEVSAKMRTFFPEGIIQRQRSSFLDLVRLNTDELRANGVSDAHIADCGVCTCCLSDRFFSYRRTSGRCGRMISVAMLR